MVSGPTVTAGAPIGNVSRPVRVQAFGPYDLIERVGVGSIGEVFRAVVRATGREVALKRLMPCLLYTSDAADE